MDTKHTPGPWCVKYDKGGTPYVGVASDPHSYPGTVAVVNTSEADADLIAAAPELLAAIDDVGALLKNWHNAIYNAVKEGRGLNADTTKCLEYNLGLAVIDLRKAYTKATRKD